MPKFSRRAAAVLTSFALASFSVHAQSALRDSPAWKSADGVVTFDATPSRETPLYTRAALSDSITSFEFRAPKGAKARAYIQGRYAVDLDGTGDWQGVAIRFRGPRMDAGFSKIANAMMLEVKV